MRQVKKLTETEIKLSDAAVQMKLALEKSDSEAVFRSCINSFISSARSVTMVMEKESAPIPDLKKWYKDEMGDLSKWPVMKFFSNQRTHSIHRASISPKANSAPIFDLKIDGIDAKSDTGQMYWWTFENADELIPGSSGNVINLCEEYFILLKNLVAAWLYKMIEIEMSDEN